METSNPSLEKLHNGHCLVDSPSHSLYNNFICGFFLEQGEGVGDVVSGAALRRDADLVGADGRLLPRLLDSLVAIHGRCSSSTSFADAQTRILSLGIRRALCGGLRSVEIVAVASRGGRRGG